MLTLVASENGKVGLPFAWRALRDGASALDAVEAGVRAVEDNPDDHSVGYAGHPNVAGVVELDASIMDGATRRAGHIASAVSTSGWAFKHPGRLGDSPVIGAGNYCDDRYGAAACTGWGELAIRAATAHTAVMAMARGASPTEAAGMALRELFELPTDGALPLMHIVVLSPTGEHAAATTLAGARYTWQDETVAEHAVSERLVIAP
jgi:isoaspartyl peptidase/L-asparaginase-like protein (Ntn-hydrolase superfamily)